MKPEPLPPVTTPPKHHWGYFRVHVIPNVACAVVFTTAVWLWSQNLANPVALGQTEAKSSTPNVVHLTPIKSDLAHEAGAAPHRPQSRPPG